MNEDAVAITEHSRIKMITADGLSAMVPTPPDLTYAPAMIGRNVTPHPCPACGMSVESPPPRQYAFQRQNGNTLIYREVTP